jgi:phospholipase C
LFVVGPNGFLREYPGAPPDVETSLSTLSEVQLEDSPNRGALELFAWSTGREAFELTLSANAYPELELPARIGVPRYRIVHHTFSLEASVNWYDFTLSLRGYPGWSRRLPGRMETGRDGVSDPALGRR